MRGLPRILSPFPNEFDKINNTGARMLDSIYHNYEVKIILSSHFWRENVMILPSFSQRYNERHYVTLRNGFFDSIA